MAAPPHLMPPPSAYTVAEEQVHEGAVTAEDHAVAAPSRPWRGWGLWLGLIVVAVLLLWGSDRLLDAYPVGVSVVGDGANSTITVGGVTRSVPLGRSLHAVRLPPTEPNRREYQVDGSDTTNNGTYNSDYFKDFASSPYYRFQGWLRDEGSYSTWRDLVIRDRAGRLVVQQARPAPDDTFPLPNAFSFALNLHRMEVPRTLAFQEDGGGTVQVEINRNDKHVQVVRLQPGLPDVLIAQWYLPYDWQPALAELLALLLRACAFGLLLVVGLVPLALLLPSRLSLATERFRRPVAVVVPVVAVGIALAATIYVSLVLLDAAPSIYDGMAYYFQAQTFAAGRLTVPVPPVPEAFPIPFTVFDNGKWFAMYTPGTALALMPAFRAGVPWLAEPLLAVGGLLLTFAIARRHYGTRTALLAIVLLATSPFLHLQAGTYMSHVPGMFWAAVLLYAATRYVERPTKGWAACAVVALGLLFFTREMSAILYALTLGPVVFWRCYTGWRQGVRSSRQLLGDAAVTLACVALLAGAYLAYNKDLTGSPFLLPRVVYSDTENRYGFGEGIGFYGRHTLGGGLVNAEEMLTSLTFTLFGWPFAFSLAFLALPFLLGRARRWDFLHGAIVASFVLAYIGLYYHGIAYGPRYYFDALPSMVLLSARGFVTLAEAVAVICREVGRERTLARARGAALLLCGGLLACNLLYFWPQQSRLYAPRSGRVGVATPALGDFVTHRAGNRVSALHHALVITRDRGLLDFFVPLGCPTLDCDTLFAYSPDDQTEQRLRAAFPGWGVYRLWDEAGLLTVEPVGQIGPPPAH